MYNRTLQLIVTQKNIILLLRKLIYLFSFFWVIAILRKNIFLKYIYYKF